MDSATPNEPVHTDPRRVGNYRLLRRIGCGSYGEVWLSRDASGRYRALKLVHRRTFDQDRPYEREYSGIQKFEPVSRLHASQVAILDVGRNEADGFFYYTMELADPAGVDNGRTLDQADLREGDEEILSYFPKTLKSEIRRQGRFAFDEALRIGIALATALDHLHRHGLVHRDIKPSNVIFVGGVPKLADIGLVTDMGATISCVGTEGFIPPEGPGTQLADIYGLGKVIYEMATGLDRLDFPELPPASDNPSERERLLELNLIFLKACQVDPAKRYRTVREMLADLALLHGGRSLRRARVLENRIRSIKRGLAASMIAVALGAASWAYWDYERGVRFRERMEETEKREEFARTMAKDLTARLSDFYRRAGESALQSGDRAQAMLWLSHAVLQDTNAASAEELQGTLKSLISASPLPRTVRALEAPGSKVECGASVDGCVAGDEQGRLYWLDAGSESRPVKIAQVSSPPRQIVVDRSARSVFLLSPSGEVSRLDRLTGQTQVLNVTGAVTNLVHDSVDVAVLGCSVLGQVIAWDIHNGAERFRFDGGRAVLGMECSPDGRWIAVKQRGGFIKILDATAGDSSASQLNHGEMIDGICFSADSKRILSWGRGLLRVWAVSSAEPGSVVLRQDGGFRFAAFLASNDRFVTVTDEGLLRLRDAISGEACGGSVGPIPAVQRMEVSADGGWVILLSEGALHLFEISHRFGLRPAGMISSAVRDFSLAQNARWLWITDGAGVVQQMELTVRDSVVHPSLRLGAREIREWAEILSGRELIQDRMSLSSAEKRLADWQKRDEIGWPFAEAPAGEGWHSLEAARREEGQDWFAAHFHWNQAFQSREARGDASARSASAYARWEGLASRPRVPDGFSASVPAPPDPLPGECVDLTRFYNARLDRTWLPAEGISARNDLNDLGAGGHRLGGILFDVRGVIQLSSAALENQGREFPRRVTGIPVNKKTRRLHFLHATAWDAPHRTVVGSYRIHFADGTVSEWNLSFGENIREWWCASAAPRMLPSTAVVWQGGNDASRQLGMSVRLFHSSWINPRPESEIAFLDFISAMERPAPFLVGLSADTALGNRGPEPAKPVK